MIGIYVPGDSLVHRARPGLKLLALLALTSLLVVVRSPGAVAVGFVAVALAYAVAGFGPRRFLAQIWPLRWILLLLIPFQWWTGGPWSVVTIVGTLVVAVLAAGLVSLTTRTTDLLDTFTWALGPLRSVRVDPERIGLLLTLTIRAVPVIRDLARDVGDARRARGLERSVRAYATPLVIRTVGYSHRLGDALVARGLDD